MLRNDRNKSGPKKGLGFDQDNIQSTRLPFGERDYGYVKVNNTETPFFKKSAPVSAKQLLERLMTASPSKTRFKYSEMSSRSTEDIKKPDPTFELRRKAFNQGEFTITRGKKTNEMYHPRVDFKSEDLSPHTSHIRAIQVMEDYCKIKHIKIAKGFQ